MSRLLLLICLSLLALPNAMGQNKSVIVKRNLDAAEQAYDKGEYEDALLSVQAALALSPHVQRAHAIAMDIHIKKQDKRTALRYALKAFDATKRGDKNSKKRTKRVLKYIRGQSLYLGTFLDLRSVTLKNVLKQRKIAAKAKRVADVEWITRIAQDVHPTHPDLEKIVGAGVPRSHFINVQSGQTNLLKSNSDWQYRNATAQSKVSDGVLSLEMKDDATYTVASYKSNQLKRSFEITFKFKYMLRGGTQDPHFSLFFSDGIELSKSLSIWSIAIDVIGQESVLFYNTKPKDGVAWTIKGVDKLEGKPLKEKAWTELVVQWDADSRALSLDIGGECVGEMTIPNGEVLGHQLGFGVGGLLTFEIKDLTATLAPTKKD